MLRYAQHDRGASITLSGAKGLVGYASQDDLALRMTAYVFGDQVIQSCERISAE